MGANFNEKEEMFTCLHEMLEQSRMIYEKVTNTSWINCTHEEIIAICKVLIELAHLDKELSELDRIVIV